MSKGKKVKLKATVAPSNATDRNVTFTSSNTKVATVNAKGVVTGNYYCKSRHKEGYM